MWIAAGGLQDDFAAHRVVQVQHMAGCGAQGGLQLRKGLRLGWVGMHVNCVGEVPQLQHRQTKLVGAQVS